MHSPFTDTLFVTVPFEDSDVVQKSFRPLLSELGASDCSGGYWEVPVLKTIPDGRVVVDTKAPKGGVGFKRYGQVLQVRATGGALRSMRAVGMVPTFLSVIGSFQHTVTRLDATVDVPVPAGPRISGLYAHVRAHGLRLGRKITPPAHCRALLRTSHYEPGVETGTVWVGRRGSAEIRATVYDKRNEVMDWGGDDVGDLLRVELSFGKDVGCTLRDLSLPGPVFWGYVGALLDPPDDFVEWTKAEPWNPIELEKLPPVDPVVRITRACERNDGLRTVIEFSDDLGIERRHLWGYMNHAHPPVKKTLFVGAA